MEGILEVQLLSIVLNQGVRFGIWVVGKEHNQE